MRTDLFGGVVVFVPVPVLARDIECPETFSLVKACAGRDRDFDHFVAEAADGSWRASAGAGTLSLDGL